MLRKKKEETREVMVPLFICGIAVKRVRISNSPANQIEPTRSVDWF